MRVWITRTLPEAARTAQRLKDAGHEPVVAPLIAVTVLPVAEALADALRQSSAIAFTSVNGVRAFAALIRAERGLPAFTVGGATAKAAREAGFAEVVSANGDVEALGALIGEFRPAGTVLHPAAAEPAGDLIGDLARRGVVARAIAIYATRGVSPPEGVLHGMGAALVHSARAARELAALLKDRPETPDLTVACMSKTAAAPLAGLPLGRLLVASYPDEASLVACLDQ
jgi:uroporphyrinogen-III synthase